MMPPAMALKFKIKSLDGLAEEVAKLYTKDSDGGFKLEVEGIEDTSALKSAKDHEKQQRKEAEAKVKQLSDELATLTEERDGLLKGAIPKGDVDKLEASWKGKLTKRENELTAELTKVRGGLEKVTLESTATAIATKISTAPKLLGPIIRNRLRLEEKDGEFVTRVLDANGQLSALTVADLEKEILDNKEFAPILIGSKGSGSGASGGRSGGGATNGKQISRTDFDALTPNDRHAFIQDGGSVTE
jgi:hypothetical protein